MLTIRNLQLINATSKYKKQELKRTIVDLWSDDFEVTEIKIILQE